MHIIVLYFILVHIVILHHYTHLYNHTGDLTSQKRSTSTPPHTSSSHTWQTTPATSTTSTRPTKRPIHTNTATPNTHNNTVVSDGGKLHPSWIAKQKKEHTGMISSIPISTTSAAVNKKIVFNDD